MRKDILSAFALILLTSPTLWMASPVNGQATAGTPVVTWSRVEVRAETLHEYTGNFDVWSWLPRVKFRAVGALPSGAHYYVEVSQPSGVPWVKLNCENDVDRVAYECGYYQNEPKDKSILTVGIVSFTIKMRNELAGTDATLFTGKAKVEKVLSNEHGPSAAKKFVYYVNQDWNMPFGMIYVDKNLLNVRFWVRGEGIHLEPHVFYQGNEVGRLFYQGMRVGAPSCKPDIDYFPSSTVIETVSQGAKWQRMDCSFESVVGTTVKSTTGGVELHVLSANNGEYEVKVLRNNTLARSIKFTVENGKIKDNGIYAANKMGTGNVVLVPVAILDNQDGTWDHAAWKTDAFYGHPVTGFTWP